jgi:ribosomal protein S18 acetylase RimI-like enzyme
MTPIRTTTAQDVDAILRIAASEPLFTTQEAACVDELLTDYLGKADHGGYYFLTAEADGQVVGFACYGPTALTDGTYDLYWICVDRKSAGKGIGTALMHRAQAEIARSKGRLIIVETSGTPAYAPTRAFYEHLGYQRVATVPSYYRAGDDLVIYTRPVTHAGLQQAGE